jgi:hypothetical protein
MGGGGGDGGGQRDSEGHGRRGEGLREHREGGQRYPQNSPSRHLKGQGHGPGMGHDGGKDGGPGHDGHHPHGSREYHRGGVDREGGAAGGAAGGGGGAHSGGSGMRHAPAEDGGPNGGGSFTGTLPMGVHGPGTVMVIPVSKEAANAASAGTPTAAAAGAFPPGSYPTMVGVSGPLNPSMAMQAMPMGLMMPPGPGAIGPYGMNQAMMPPMVPGQPYGPGQPHPGQMVLAPRPGGQPGMMVMTHPGAGMVSGA